MALILIFAFLFFAVFLRATTQWFNTGDFGVRLASPKAPMIEILPGTIFVISFAVACVIIVFYQLDMISNVYELPHSLRWAAFTIGVIGILFTLAAQYQMGDSWRIGVDSSEVTTLKTGGLYARSRNPIYFGILLVWIGLCLTLINPLLWLCAVVCWVCIELIVRKIEEPYLVNIHKEVFLDYAKETNRYLPI
ncbi:MAG: isoprenylcysteine carboxylmethyltransferase family protein [Acidiferrobacterales bacterium]|nr:isoprenylcysteine carboxylmethyltransferase family protein [Acidiferrobacterales bacterium]